MTARKASTVQIVYHPDPVLRRRALPIASIDDAVRDRAREMIALMHEARGIGLAAPQVGWSQRLAIVCPSGEPGEERVLINPEILEDDGEAVAEEGCLSFPKVYGNVARATWIRYAYTDLDGNRIEVEAEDLPARVVQHEIDHLDGIVFTMRMSPADRMSTKKAVRELEKRAKERDGR